MLVLVGYLSFSEVFPSRVWDVESTRSHVQVSRATGSADFFQHDDVEELYSESRSLLGISSAERRFNPKRVHHVLPSCITPNKFEHVVKTKHNATLGFSLARSTHGTLV